MTAAEETSDNSNTRGWLFDKSNQRSIKKVVELDPSDYHDDEIYSCSSPPESPCRTDDQVVDHSQTINTAELALAYYNKKHDTHYELVEPILSNGCIWRSELWIHANFRASNSPKKSLVDSSTKLFFAELKICHKSGVPKDVVTACRPLNGAKSTSCEMCGVGALDLTCDDRIFHPTGRFRQGLYATKPRDLRPRRNGRVA